MYRRAFEAFVHHRLAVTGFAFLAIEALVAILAPYIAPHNPLTSDFNAFHASPSRDHLLGTDLIGRDVLSRLMYGLRISLLIGILAAGLAVSIGTAIGACAGYFRGFVDAVLMRFTDMALSFPPLIIILVVVSLLGPSVTNVILVLGGLGWPIPSRIVRSSYLSLREQEFTLAAKVSGTGNLRIIFHHLLPNALGPVLVAGSLGTAYAILTEAALSFIGLGVPPPTPSLGNMLADAQSVTILHTMPWIWIPPGIVIVATVLAVNFVGDGIRDALDPRSLRFSVVAPEEEGEFMGGATEYAA